MKLDKLLERLDYTVVQGSDSTEVTTLINDSRKVEEGSVFVCISGAVSDGHDICSGCCGERVRQLLLWRKRSKCRKECDCDQGERIPVMHWL